MPMRRKGIRRSADAEGDSGNVQPVWSARNGDVPSWVRLCYMRIGDPIAPRRGGVEGDGTMKEIIVSQESFNVIYQQNRDYLFEKYGYLPVLFDTAWVDNQSGKRVLFHKGTKIIEN